MFLNITSDPQIIAGYNDNINSFKQQLSDAKQDKNDLFNALEAINNTFKQTDSRAGRRSMIQWFIGNKPFGYLFPQDYNGNAADLRNLKSNLVNRYNQRIRDINSLTKKLRQEENKKIAYLEDIAKTATTEAEQAKAEEELAKAEEELAKAKAEATSAKVKAGWAKYAPFILVAIGSVLFFMRKRKS